MKRETEEKESEQTMTIQTTRTHSSHNGLRTSDHLNGASHTFDHEAPTSTEMSDIGSEETTVLSKRAEFRNVNHNVRSLRNMARDLEKATLAVKAETKRKEKLMARIEAARVALREAERTEYDIDAAINGKVGQRLVRNR